MYFIKRLGKISSLLTNVKQQFMALWHALNYMISVKKNQYQIHVNSVKVSFHMLMSDCIYTFL